MKFSLYIFALGFATISTPTAFGQGVNLVKNGDFGDGLAFWMTSSVNPGNNDGTKGWATSKGEYGISNLAYSGLAASAATVRDGFVYNTNNFAVGTDYDSLLQNVSGLQTAAAANGGTLSIWFNTAWENATGTNNSYAAGLTVLVNGVAYANFVSGPTTASTGGSFTTSNGASLNTGTYGTGTTFSNSWKVDTFGRFNLTIPNYTGTDNATPVEFRFFTAIVGGTDILRDDFRVDNVVIATPAPVPEPISVLCMATGIGGLIARRRKK